MCFELSMPCSSIEVVHRAVVQTSVSGCQTSLSKCGDTVSFQLPFKKFAANWFHVIKSWKVTLTKCLPCVYHLWQLSS